jgi:hypothetical protein
LHTLLNFLGLYLYVCIFITSLKIPFCICCGNLFIVIGILPLHQPISSVRAETEIKLGGTQCNIIMSRLKPWLLLHLSKKKKIVLREEASVVVKPQSIDSRIIMWTCNVSAPDMTIVLFDMVGSPVYHVSTVIICVCYCNRLLISVGKLKHFFGKC